MIKKLFFMCFMMIASNSAHAWDGYVSGKIASLDGAGNLGGAPGNMDLRVTLIGVTSLCTATTSSYAYINMADANYKVIAGLLMLAYSTGRSVEIISRIGPAGVCEIGYVSVKPE